MRILARVIVYSVFLLVLFMLYRMITLSWYYSVNMDFKNCHGNAECMQSISREVLDPPLYIKLDQFLRERFKRR